MCLAYLLNYEEPEDPSLIVQNSIAIKRRILGGGMNFDGEEEEEEEKAEEDDFFDFEAINMNVEGDVE